MAENFSFEITEAVGIIATSKGGWTTELNKVSWNGKPAKYDIRAWDAQHDKMGKGITLTAEELTALKDLLNKIEIK